MTRKAWTILFLAGLFFSAAAVSAAQLARTPAAPMACGAVACSGDGDCANGGRMCTACDLEPGSANYGTCQNVF